ncbi:Proteasome subunit alpha type-3 [Toxocara canis]|uniref:Proteasome subunit alpha type-3 n=1 Tax=Toxocara canis TaxID=6265 RepID=A0A0B2V3S5_TOXCA|nr:Proteasome subunit alpha type-3 [Toxocara canis]
MSSIGTGYDLAAATFSPDGRIFQVEYAQKAVDNGGTMIALKGRDGVVTAVDKLIPSKLYVANANPRMANAGENVGVALAGVYPDCRALLDYAVGEALKYLRDYRTPMPIKKLAEQLAEYVHIFTLGISRPFGASVFLTAWDKKNGSKLFLIEPSGLCYEYKAWAIGKHRQAAKTEIEKLKLDDLTMEQLVREAARIILTVRDEAKDKNLQIEMGWVGESTNGKHHTVPPEIVKEAESWAKAKLEEDDMEE